MPLNGSGTYSAPANSWNPAVTSTTINSTDWAALLADLTTALSTALYKDGQQIPTANLPMGGFKLTGLGAGSAAGNSVRWEQSAPGVVTAKGDLVIASASGAIARLAVGTDFQITRADSTATNGVKYDWPAASSAVGLSIASRTNSGTPNTKFDISADSLVVKDANGGAMHLASVAVTVDMSVVGANGIDAGSQASSTWYYGYVIAKPDGTTAGLASTSSSAPTMPSGYTFKALITAVRSDGSTHFIPYRQLGNWVYYETQQNIVSVTTSPTSEQGVSVATLVPPNALAFKLNIYGTVFAGAGGAFNQQIGIRFITGKAWTLMDILCSASGGTGFGCASDVPNVGQNFAWLYSANTNWASGTTQIDVQGFKLPGGGE